MAGYDDISSTERLLNVIRDGDADMETPERTPAKQKGPVKVKSPSMRRAGTVGLDIGYDNIRLAKINKKRQLLDFQTIPFPHDVTRDSAKFPQFLKTALSGFCRKDTELWAVIPTAGVEMRYLRIPRLPKRQVANAVYWTYKKENPFNEQEAIFDFDIIGDTIEEGIKKTEVLAYSAPIQDVRELKNLVSKTGYSLTGITAVPFAFQNLFRTKWIDDKKGDVCNLYVGRNWSRIDVFADGNLLLSRGIKAGMNSMIEGVRDGFNEKIDAEKGEIEITIELADEDSEKAPAKEEQGPIGMEEAGDIFFDLVDDSIATDALQRYGLTEDEVFNMLQPALDRLVRQIERTLEHYYQKLKGEPVGIIYSTGQVSSNRRILDYIAGQLGVQVETVDPFGMGAPFTAPRGTPSPRSVAERVTYAPALGMALSDNTYTPNFNYTYKDKQAADNVRRMQAGLFSVFLIIFLVLGGVFLWQGRSLAKKTAEADKLQEKLDKFVPNVNRDLITQLLGILKRNEDTMDKYGRKYQGMAIISELAGMTPAHIRLTSIKAELGEPSREAKQAEKEKKKAEEKKVDKKLEIEGIVVGDRNKIEPALAQYLLSLQMSPLFGQPSIKEQSIRVFEGREVLLFSAELEVM